MSIPDNNGTSADPGIARLLDFQRARPRAAERQRSKDSSMRVEFVPDGDDCPAILFHGCPSAGAEALINAFRSLAEGRETEVALHQLPGVIPVGEVQVFAIDGEVEAGVQQFSTLAFRWRKDKEGWLETVELAKPVAHSEPKEGTRFQYLERNGKVNVIFSTNRVW